MKKNECTGFEKSVPKGFVPTIVYHVTVDADKVCYEGLKDPNDRWKESKRRKKPYRTGVGGNTDDKISVTFNQERAVDYFNDMITISKIANGSLTFNNMCEFLNSHDKSEKMAQTPCELWQKLNNGNDLDSFGLFEGKMKQLENGRTDIKRKGTIEVIKELSKEDAIKWGLGDGTIKERFAKFFELPHEQRKAINDHFLYQPATQKELREELLKYWDRGYLKLRRDAGGRQDPVFMNIELDRYQKDPQQIAITKLKVYLPRSLDNYMEFIRQHRFEYGDEMYDPEYGFPDENHYKGKFKIMTGEEEIRINPEWYNRLEIIKRGK